MLPVLRRQEGVVEQEVEARRSRISEMKGSQTNEINQDGRQEEYENEKKTMKKIVATTLFALVVLAPITQAAQPEMRGPFLPQNEAYDLMTDAQTEEAEAYALGIQAYLWGMKYVRSGQSHRIFASPLPEDKERSPVEALPPRVFSQQEASSQAIHGRLLREPVSTPHCAWPRGPATRRAHGSRH